MPCRKAAVGFVERLRAFARAVEVKVAPLGIIIIGDCWPIMSWIGLKKDSSIGLSQSQPGLSRR